MSRNPYPYPQITLLDITKHPCRSPGLRAKNVVSKETAHLIQSQRIWKTTAIIDEQASVVSAAIIVWQSTLGLRVTCSPLWLVGPVAGSQSLERSTVKLPDTMQNIVLTADGTADGTSRSPGLRLISRTILAPNDGL